MSPWLWDAATHEAAQALISSAPYPASTDGTAWLAVMGTTSCFLFDAHRGSIFIFTLLHLQGEGTTCRLNSQNDSAMTWPPLSHSAGGPVLSSKISGHHLPRNTTLAPCKAGRAVAEAATSLPQECATNTTESFQQQTSSQNPNRAGWSDNLHWNKFFSELSFFLEQNEGQEMPIQNPYLPWCGYINILHLSSLHDMKDYTEVKPVCG